MFQKSVPFSDVRLLPEQVAKIDQILAKARDSALPEGAVTFWPGGKFPRTQVYDGPCDERLVQQLREVVGPTVKVSIVRSTAQYASYRIRTKQNPSGNPQPQFAKASK